MAWYEFALVQITVLIVVYSFFKWQNKKETAKPQKPVRDDSKEIQNLRSMRSHSLTKPLCELTRPSKLSDIIGQAAPIEALRAAICGKNPQHVIIYGPPGVGKTCAARLLLEEAKKSSESPFCNYSKFVELDATCIRFDERSIADPLLGSVHDPIYQGAGAFGSAGIPQPKPGAVTKAHCGVLFLDEIGELHPLQMNKLLKVLEDRCVHFESSYYSQNNSSIPQYIHDIFQNGLPADFRLIGATTRSPDEIPPALRSRCVEIHFNALDDENLFEIAQRATAMAGQSATESALKLCAAYSMSGRDCVNIIQLAGSIAANMGESEITPKHIEWVAQTCHHVQKYTFTMPQTSKTGNAFGLGVASNFGMVLEIECSVRRATGQGSITVNGAVEQEEIEYQNKKLKRKSLAYASVHNVICAVNNCFNIDCRKYDITFNIPGGHPVDGPSAGAAFCTALLSALTLKQPKAGIALTGEVTPSGQVRAVGAIREKIEAAQRSGAKAVIIPLENLPEAKSQSDIEIIAISNIRRLAHEMFPSAENTTCALRGENLISAAPTQKSDSVAQLTVDDCH